MLNNNNRAKRATVTIHDVARHAKVSSMTVSRVINGQPNVREALRQRVLESIKELDYTPNIAARSTRIGLGATRIGILFSNPSESYLSKIMVGSLEQSRKLGCQLIPEYCAGLSSQKKAVDRLVEAGVEGVILPPPLCDSESTVRMLTGLDIPVVALATARPLPEVSAVYIDDYRSAISITRHLIKLGHRKIAFVKGDPAHTPSECRLEGFLKAMDEAGLTVPENWIAPGRFTYKSGLAAAEMLLSGDETPTAILASNDDMAAAVISVAQGRGIRVPEELSVAGFDDTPIASIIWPDLTTIHQPITAMGSAAVSIIHKMVSDLRKGGALKPIHQRMTYKLVKRHSSGKALS